MATVKPFIKVVCFYSYRLITTIRTVSINSFKIRATLRVTLLFFKISFLTIPVPPL